MNYTSSSFWTAFLRFPSRQFFLKAFQSDNAEQIKKIQRHRWRGQSWGFEQQDDLSFMMLQRSVHAMFFSHHVLNEWKICSVKREERFFDEFPAQQRQSPSMDSRASIFSLFSDLCGASSVASRGARSRRIFIIRLNLAKWKKHRKCRLKSKKWKITSE